MFNFLLVCINKNKKKLHKVLYTHNHNDINNNCIYTKTQVNSLLFRYEPFINFWLRFFDTSRDTILKSFVSYNANNTPNVWNISWCFGSQFIFAGQNPKDLTATAMVENSIVCLHGPMSTFNSMVRLQLLNIMVGTQLNLFQNLPNSQPISSGHDVIHTPATFPIWGLLWQWGLSYPLCASVNCTNWLHTNS